MKSIRIVSGGQTGVDRAALAWAVRNHFAHGGWCPRGRKGEWGPIPMRYHLRETPTGTYEQRTLLNVRDSDGTLILSLREGLSAGSAKTARFCLELGKPRVHLAAEILTPREAGLAVRHFVARHHIRTLNIAGPRASEEESVERFVRAVLDEAFEIRPRRASASGRREIHRRSRSHPGSSRRSAAARLRHSGAPSADPSGIPD